MRLRPLRLLLGLTLLCPSLLSAEPSDFDPGTGYRTAHYRAPTPADVPGGTRIDIEALDKLMATGDLVLVDVMPVTGRGYDPGTGRWLATKTHTHIPGSIWLPDVGKGRISDDLDRYFRDNLARLTGGDMARPLLIYCQSDCWMGWNAVQRAAAYGYSHLYWYAEGIDGWRDYERPATPASPVPVAIRPSTSLPGLPGTSAAEKCPLRETR